MKQPWGTGGASEAEDVRTAIVGAGPTGLYLAIALARRGHVVTLVERDAGPAPSGAWARKGVMQFHHPHGFRGQVADALSAEMPEVVDAIVTVGGIAIRMPEQPDRIVGLRCRRATFERVLRQAAVEQPGIELRIGHADRVCVERGRATGVVVDGSRVDADLVIDASGRAGRLSRGLRAPAQGGDCGFAYTSRQFELRPGAEPGPLNAPIGFSASYPGYQLIVFPHDLRTFSAVIIRLAADRPLGALRHQPAFEAACRAIPGLSVWTDPKRAQPISDVQPGGRLTNTYQGQRGPAGVVAVAGLMFVGDAVCTTNPSAGRGVSTSLMQARRLLELVDEHGSDADSSLAFDDWCETQIRPWYTDHAYTDARQVRRWSGEDVDCTERLPSDLIVSASQADPSMMPVVGPYLGMNALPHTLAAVEPRAREIYAGGWRPPIPPGPSRDELADLVTHAASSPVR